MNLEWQDQKTGSAYADFEFAHLTLYYEINPHDDPRFDLWSVEFGAIMSEGDTLKVWVGKSRTAAKMAARNHLAEELAKLTGGGATGEGK